LYALAQTVPVEGGGDGGGLVACPESCPNAGMMVRVKISRIPVRKTLRLVRGSDNMLPLPSLLRA
jgi:hypothetical protein